MRGRNQVAALGDDRPPGPLPQTPGGPLTELSAAPMPAQLTHTQMPCTATGSADRILIIDDDLTLVEALSLRLEQHGFQVSRAASGGQGRVAAHRDHPDLIILDLRLPDIDGYTLCQELAGEPDTCATPVIVLSGMSRPDIIRRSRASRSEYYVRKPYDPKSLLILIRHSIDESRGWRHHGRHEVAREGST